MEQENVGLPEEVRVQEVFPVGEASAGVEQGRDPARGRANGRVGCMQWLSREQETIVYGENGKLGLRHDGRWPGCVVAPGLRQLLVLETQSPKHGGV